MDALSDDASFATFVALFASLLFVPWRPCRTSEFIDLAPVRR
jgi:hypothetical protein